MFLNRYEQALDGLIYYRIFTKKILIVYVFVILHCMHDFRERCKLEKHLSI